jgi:glycine cleavage system H protein
MTLKYTPDHEWIEPTGDGPSTVGITLHAQDALGDVVFVDLPEVGRTYAKGEVAGVVESVKAAADVYMPLDGEVTEVNEALRADPSLANSDPLGQGWFFKIRLSHPGELESLMDETAYAAFSQNS